jgi:hypothetical protein
MWNTPTRVRNRIGVVVLATSIAFLVTACGGGEPETAAPGDLAVEGQELTDFELTSPAFAEGDGIPAHFTCEGEDVSPALAWAGHPPETVSLALLVDDPDAPGGTFTHWLAWDIDPAAGSLPEGSPAPAEGKSGFGDTGYRGPCPPRGDGPHRYVFRLYALDEGLELDSGADKGAFQAALEGHVLGTAELTGTYERR